MVGCDGVCSGVPGSKQPTVCKEVEFSLTVINCMILETFRLEYKDDYEYEFQVLSTRNSKIFALQT